MNSAVKDYNKTWNRPITQDGRTTMRLLITSLSSVALIATASLGVAGIDGTGYTQGAVQRIASVFVNDVKYETGSASIWIDGQPGSEEQLQVGQIVGVLGTVNPDGVTGRADEVFLNHQVVGPVERLTPMGLNVLGQTVVVDETTVVAAEIADFSVTSLQVGDRVAISGRRLADGRVLASWIGRAAERQPLTVLGRASAVRSRSGRFKLHGLTVTARLARLEGISAIRAGDLVQVTGAFRVGRLLIARSVRAIEDPRAASGRATLSGFSDGRGADDTFMLDGRRINLVPGTFFEGGTAEDIRRGVEVTVSGWLNGDQLVATAVRLAPPADHCVAGPVEAINVDAATLNIGGTPINVNRTRLVDHSILAVRRFHLAHVNVGDYLRVCGRYSATGLQAGLLARLPVAGQRFGRPSATPRRFPSALRD